MPPRHRTPPSPLWRAGAAVDRDPIDTSGIGAGLVVVAGAVAGLSGGRRRARTGVASAATVCRAVVAGVAAQCGRHPLPGQPACRHRLFVRGTAAGSARACASVPAVRRYHASGGGGRAHPATTDARLCLPPQRPGRGQCAAAARAHHDGGARLPRHPRAAGRDAVPAATRHRPTGTVVRATDACATHAAGASAAGARHRRRQRHVAVGRPQLPHPLPAVVPRVRTVA
eukprot:ctg_172.g87